MFVSTGILLQRLLLDPSMLTPFSVCASIWASILNLFFLLVLNDLSHVIIDEAHERDLNIDLLLLLMKELLEKNDRIRVVIMSATINAELFQQYFNNCPLISIPGFMHNVNTYFIDVSWSFYAFDLNSAEIILYNVTAEHKILMVENRWGKTAGPRN